MKANIAINPIHKTLNSAIKPAVSMNLPATGALAITDRKNSTDTITVAIIIAVTNFLYTSIFQLDIKFVSFHPAEHVSITKQPAYNIYNCQCENCNCKNDVNLCKHLNYSTLTDLRAR